MLIDLSLLVEYTDWERHQWHDFLRQHGDQVLKISAGPHGDGRFETVGDLVRHIFSAETRYTERLSDKPLTDTVSIPTDNIEALFRFGQQSRTALKEFVETLPTREWDAPRDYVMANNPIRATPRSRSPPLGSDCHLTPHEGFEGRLPRFPVQPSLGRRCPPRPGQSVHALNQLFRSRRIRRTNREMTRAEIAGTFNRRLGVWDGAFTCGVE